MSGATKLMTSSGGGVSLTPATTTATDVTVKVPVTGVNNGTLVCSDSSGNVSAGTGNLSFNSGYGSVATAYGCRAWVNFNGTGTVAIRASGNVSSITDRGTGNYYVNFTNSMPDTNYSFAGATAWAAGTEPSCLIGQSTGDMETGRCGVVTLTNGGDTTYDLSRVYVVFVR